MNPSGQEPRTAQRAQSTVEWAPVEVPSDLAGFRSRALEVGALSYEIPVFIIRAFDHRSRSSFTNFGWILIPIAAEFLVIFIFSTGLHHIWLPPQIP